MNKENNDYLSGKNLYGNDFTIEQISEWYIDESEAYANLGAKEKTQYKYEYHKLNIFHSFRHIDNFYFKRALGIGSAYGDEFIPIADQIEKITIIDPSDAFSHIEKIVNTPCEHIKPEISGTLIFEDNTFNLITSFGALHHIPNVSHVLRECYRCLENNGVMLIREPISSMGDWRVTRKGLTKRERGIPIDLFDKFITDAGFTIVRKTLCDFGPLTKICSSLGIQMVNSKVLIWIDIILSKLFSWNNRYYRPNISAKFAPGSVSYILLKSKSTPEKSTPNPSRRKQ